MQKTSLYIGLSLSLLAFISLSSCYEEREGCLDFEAVNYDIDADLDCADCCTYPQFTLELLHRFAKNDTIYPLGLADSVYLDSKGHPYRINQLTYLLSNFRLVDENGNDIKTYETLQANVYDPSGNMVTQSIADNFARVNTSSFSSLGFGSFKGSGIISAVQFDIGLADSMLALDPTSLPDDHSLHPNQGSYDLNSKTFNLISLGIYRDTTASDTIPVVTHLQGPNHLRTVTLNMASPFPLELGKSVHIVVEADYSPWLEGFCVQNDTSEDFVQKLADNLQFSNFELLRVEAR